MTSRAEANPIIEVPKVFLGFVRPFKSLSLCPVTNGTAIWFSKVSVYPLMETVVSNLISFPLVIVLSLAVQAHRLILTFIGAKLLSFQGWVSRYAFFTDTAYNTNRLFPLSLVAAVDGTVSFSNPGSTASRLTRSIVEGLMTGLTLFLKPHKDTVMKLVYE